MDRDPHHRLLSGFDAAIHDRLLPLVNACNRLTDKYPPFSMGAEPDYPVRLEIDERIENRNRLTTFWPIRLLLAIPHLIIIGILQYVMMVVVFIAWIIALITGSVPGGLHNFLAGYLRWYERTYAYILLLIDEYPPFSLS